MAPDRPLEASARQRMLEWLLRRLRRTHAMLGWARYAITLGIVLLAFGIRLALEGIYSYPFITFVPAILVAAFLFGRGPGILAALASATLAFWFFVEPRYGAAFAMPSRLVALAMFVGIGLLAAWLIDMMRSMVEELAQANRQLQGSDLQKDLLLADINHRLKNSLHAVAGILSNDGRRSGDPTVSLALEDAAARIRVLARVHERLQLGSGATALSQVSMAEFLDALGTDLQQTLVALRPVTLHVQAEDIHFAVGEAVSLGLLANELVTNATRHAFPEGRSGTIRLRLHRLGEQALELEVADDGVGLGPGEDLGGTGSRLLTALAQQLGGAIARERLARGTRVAVRFPVPAAARVPPAIPPR